jgi:hypothetical protein
VSNKKITLPTQPQAQVVLADPDLEAGERVYRLVAPTRSVKRQLAEVQEQLDGIRRDLEQIDQDGGTVPPDTTDKLTRLWCDELNLVLKGGDDAPPAGDLLYDGYMADRVTDDQIRNLHGDLAGAVADPT